VNFFRIQSDFLDTRDSPPALPGAGIEPTTFLSLEVALTTGLASDPRQGYLFLKSLLKTQSQKGKKFKNPAAQQRSSPQGCTVRPESSAGQSSLEGYLAPRLFPPPTHTCLGASSNPSAAIDFHVICGPGHISQPPRMPHLHQSPPPPAVDMYFSFFLSFPVNRSLEFRTLNKAFV